MIQYCTCTVAGKESKRYRASGAMDDAAGPYRTGSRMCATARRYARHAAQSVCPSHSHICNSSIRITL